MAAKGVFVPEAELDVSEAYAWYELRRPGLGEEFLTSLEATIERLCRQPFSCPVIHETYRRALNGGNASLDRLTGLLPVRRQ